MEPQLTPNAIQDMLVGLNPPNPVVQIGTIRQLNPNDSGGGASQRFRAQLSDGTRHQPCMLATQLSQRVHSEEISKFTIVRVDKHVCNTIQDRKIIIIIALTVLKRGQEVGRLLGNPQQLEIQKVVPGQPSSNGHYQPPQSTSGAGMQQQHQPRPPPPQSAAPPPRAAGSMMGPSGGGGFYSGSGASGGAPKTPTRTAGMPAVRNTSPSQRNIFPINSLNPYQSRWTIRARVTAKPPLRTYSNSRGEGKIMSVDLLDESGEIRATAFNEAADKFYHVLEVDKVYFITRCQLKPANKQFTSLKNDYEMYIRDDTEVEECKESTPNLPKMQFKFTPISQIEQTESGNLIDVIGVVKSTAEVASITTRQTNRRVSKRDVQLMDRSERVVQLTLWGAEAEGFDGSNNPVLAIRGAKVSDFGGRSISTLGSSMVLVNPDIKEAHELRGWYEHVGKNQAAVSISQAGAGGSGSNATLAVSQIKSLDLGRREKPDYFNLCGTITYIRKENCLYQACPSAECNKKVTEGMGGHGYFCEKCNQHFPNFKWRLMLSISISDYSGGTWLTVFQDQAEMVLGRKSAEIGELKEQNEQEFDSVCQMANFQDFTFRTRAKMDTWQDEQRVRVTCVAVNRLDYAQEAKRLLEETRKLMAQ